MDMKQALERLDRLELTMYAYGHAQGLLTIDGSTVAPKGSGEGRAKAMSVLSGESHRQFASGETGELLEYLNGRKEELDFVTRRRVEELTDSYQRLSRIPLEEYVAYAELLSRADDVWHKAKEQNDFELFRPELEEVIAFSRRFAAYYEPDMEPYDALLNEYEKGVSVKMLDGFFREVRDTIVPLLHEIREKEQIDDSLLHQYYPIETQRTYSDYLMSLMPLDRRYCNIQETEHPFTGGPNKYDVRLTTHYYENDVSNSMYSVLHEGGHAMYDLSIGDELQFTCLGNGASMGVHESQSRFYENIIGRSLPFIRAIFPKVQELFPAQLGSHTAEEFYRAVNRVEPSLIRIQADELTYCLHIMVRYELEKQLIAGSLAVRDIPEVWNRLYKEYLGVDVPDNRRGCLQDSHWSTGYLGYFPTYALGSAYGAQLLNKMEQEFDVWGQVGAGDLSGVTRWLNEHIHRYGKLYHPTELMKRCMGDFDPTYYTAYLTRKYRELYRI